MSPSLQLRLLGPLEVQRDGAGLDLGAPKQRAVLGRLLLARGRVVAVDQLLEAAWGEELPASATGSLQVYVSHLRRLLGGEGGLRLERRGAGYALASGSAAVDLDEVARVSEEVRSALAREDWSGVVTAAEAALGQWRGELLGDLGEAGWLVAERVTWASRRLDLEAARVSGLAGSGRSDDAARAATALVQEDPLRDDLVRLAMLALTRAGRGAQALEAYAAHVARLGDQLGIEPAAEVRELHVALLRQDPWTTWWPAAAAPTDTRAAVPAAVPAAPTRPVPPTSAGPGSPGPALVGRADELRVAGSLVEEVVAGAPRTLVLTGPAGIGKTRLAEAVLDLVADRGGRVVRSRSTEEQGVPAWWPMRQLVRELGQDPDEVLATPADADADTVRFALYERLRSRLEAAAGERPLGVLVDDVQWADTTSVAALGYLVAATSGPVLFVVTARDGEDLAGRAPELAGLLRAPGSRHLVVPPLGVEEVGRLAARVGGQVLSDDQSRRLAEQTGGNALFVTEYARLPEDARAQGEVPLAVRGVLGRRVAQLDDAVLAVLQVAAVVGDELDLDLVVRVSGASYDEVLDRLDEATAAHIVVPAEGGGGYAFSHGLVRQEVLAGLSTVRRHRLHARVAQVLATAGRDGVAGRARHLVDAGPLAEPRDLLEACRAAALQAEEGGAAETAVQWWQRASDAWLRLPADDRRPQERDDLIVARVEALVRAGRGQTVLDAVDDELLDAARGARWSTVGRLAATLLRCAGTWPWVTQGRDPGPVLARLRHLEPLLDADPVARVRVLAAAAVGSCYDPDPAVPDHLSRRALELAEGLDDPDALADALLGRVLTYVGEAGHAVECQLLLDRLLALPRSGTGAADQAVAHSAMTMSRFLLGDVAGVEAHLRRAVAAADLLRLPTVRAQLRWMESGLVHWHEGAERALLLHSAATSAHRATELYESSGFSDLTALALLWDLGRLADRPDHEGVEPLTWTAAVAAARGQHDRAADLVRQRLDETTPPAWSTMAHLVVVGDVVVRLGDPGLAAEVLDRLAPYAGLLATFGQGPVAGPVDLVRARLLLLLDRPEEARDAAAAARSLASRNDGPVWVERAQRLLDGPASAGR